MTRVIDQSRESEEVAKGRKTAKHGVVRKRTPEGAKGGWEFRLELEIYEAQRCQNCTARYWLDDAPLTGCPNCGGELLAVSERRQVSKGGFATQREAVSALAKARVARDGGEDVARRDSKERVAEHLREWLAGVKPSVKPTTWRSYEMHVHKYLIPRLGSIPLRRLTTPRIAAAYQELRETGRLKDKSKKPDEMRPLSALSVRHTHAVLRLALKDAVLAGKIPSNPALGVKLPKRERGESREMQTWTAEHLHRFLECTKGSRLHELLHVAAFTGLRRGELLGLRWTDVSMPDDEGSPGRLHVRQSMVSVGGKAEVSSPKTESGERVISIDPSTVQALRGQMVRQLLDHEKWRDAWRDTGHVFTIENGQPLHPERVSKLFAQAVEGAIAKAADDDPTSPLPRIRFHDLRHTHATLALQARIPVKVVSQRLGHKSTRITEDIYQHVLREQQDEAAIQIADLVLNVSRPQEPADDVDSD